jgi:hypothetical protein
VDANGNTAFVIVAADQGAAPIFTTIQIGGARGFLIQGLTVKSDEGVPTMTRAPRVDISAYLKGGHWVPSF